MFLSSLLAGLNRWLRYRETLRELASLSDRQLDDLGISRSDIPSAARNGR